MPRGEGMDYMDHMDDMDVTMLNKSKESAG